LNHSAPQQQAHPAGRLAIGYMVRKNQIVPDNGIICAIVTTSLSGSAVQFINPLTDFAFKKIFGSDESHDILLSFLNAVLGFESPYRIREVRIEDPCLAPQIKGMKDSFVDVRATDEQGRQFIIEMQVLPVESFEQRILYNACKKYAGQIAKGDDYHLLNDVIALTITDFLIFENTDMVSKFRLRDETGRDYSEDLELIFVELPKFTKTETELDNILDKWLYFLRFTKRLTSIPAKLAQEKTIEHAFANRAQMTPEELEAQDRREMFIQDQRGIAQKALKTGHAQGKAEGKEEGRREERQALARNLLGMGMDEAGIAKAIGLSVEELRQLLA
jgi:predicted transposase/invertase (TIGR01784 family)